MLLGRTEASVEALGRAYQFRLDAGELTPAIRSAFWAAYQLLNGGDFAQGFGWVARLRKAVESAPADSVGHAYALAQMAFKLTALDNDYSAGHDAATKAVEIARRSGESDLVAMALTVVGRALLRLGDIKAGMSRLDEAMLEIAGGGVSTFATGAAYCTVIDGCAEVFDLVRAREWTEALTAFCSSQPGMLSFNVQCLVHRSAIRQMAGDWQLALADADEACHRFEVTDRFAAGIGLYRMAEIQRAFSQWDLAEASYRKASEYGEDPQPGLGLLWLHSGRFQPALAAVERALAEAKDSCRKARFLPALVEIALAAGDIPKAREAAVSLAEIASSFSMAMLQALSAKASGAVKLAEGDAIGALPDLRDSQQTWRRLGAPFEEAQVRLLIAKACRVVGDDETANLEDLAAQNVIDSVGAKREKPRPLIHPLSGREMEVLNLLARGHSNQLIADDLFLAVRTVDRHVSNILTKLGVNSRTAAVSYAYRHGLVAMGNSA